MRWLQAAKEALEAVRQAEKRLFFAEYDMIHKFRNCVEWATYDALLVAYGNLCRSITTLEKELGNAKVWAFQWRYGWGPLCAGVRGK